MNVVGNYLTGGGWALLFTCGACNSSLPTTNATETAAEPAPTATNTDPSTHNDNERGVLARVEVEPAHLITFYETAPGVVLVVERRRSSQEPILQGEAVDPLEVYGSIRPSEEIPQALLDASGRAMALKAAEPASNEQGLERVAGGGRSAQTASVSDVHEREDGLGVSQQAFTSDSSGNIFINNTNSCSWANVWSTCRIHWGGGFFCSTTATREFYAVDHYAGDGVTVRVTQGGTSISDFFLPAGFADTYYGTVNPGPNMVRRLDVLNAAGDSFHVGCRFF